MTANFSKSEDLIGDHKGSLYRSFFKHFIDWFLALLALIFLSPLFIIVALLIKLDSKGPVFFLQERLGRHGKVFKIIKFRSMVKDMNVPVGSQKIVESDSRITRVGRIIRKTSIDELPQIINILKGEMSFIGPRPPVTTHPKPYNEYNDFEKRRFLVRPGLSGLVQVKQREINDWDKNIPVDVEYVKIYSFRYDLKLFLRSFLVFFITDNIYSKE
ncbi:MAG: sugar transferase [Bacteroidales bacterium]|jgi:lipopolysaccharide/colanic/teichoic acid biosynthesis glycosyltransferase